MAHVVDAAIIDDVDVSKSATRSMLKDGLRFKVASVADVVAGDYSAYWGIEIGAVPYDRSTGSTLAHNGTSVLVDTAGTRFLRAATTLYAGINPRGVYSAGTTYAKNDSVSYDGSSYVSIDDGNVGNQPDTSTSDWQLLSVGTPGADGAGLDFDVQVADIAARAAYDAEAEGYRVLVTDTGDGRAAVYEMGSGGSADWGAAIYVTGDPGADGISFIWMGAYSGATAYDENDVVLDQGSSWVALQSTTGNAPPTLPTTSNAYWELMAKAGADGAGSGSVTSVDLAVPTGFAVSGGPISTSGTITVAFDTGYQGYTTAEATKLGYLTVTQAVDLDAIETRVNALDAAVVLKGTWDASAGTFPGGGTAQAGDSYIVSVGGTVDSVTFAAGDRIIAITDNASTTTFAANWFKADYTDAYSPGGTDVPVADGGTGRSSHTAYAVLCGGTSSTAAQQSIASVGSSGHVLTSNGAGALPTFQAPSGGGAPVPTSSALPVGYSTYLRNTSGGAITNGSSVAGSDLTHIVFENDATPLTNGVTLSGTWVQISGATVADTEGALFVRTA